MKLNLHNSEFMLSAVHESHYPAHELPEVALVGRSNVGKSSLINTLVRRRKFARTSSRPGMTQTLNFYRVDRLVLVDLPGYGFAQVPRKIRENWGPMIESYLTKRPNLKGIIQLVDIRHKPTEDDCLMCDWLKALDKPFLVVATKADKVSRGQWARHLKVIRETLGVEALPFSAETGHGAEAIWQEIANFVSGSRRSSGIGE